MVLFATLPLPTLTGASYDEVHVEAWLPLSDYNGRLHAFGGGGWEAGRNFLSELMMIGAIGEGFAAVTTGAGLVGGPTAPWGLLSDGNSNLYELRNLGTVSLYEKVRSCISDEC